MNVSRRSGIALRVILILVGISAVISGLFVGLSAAMSINLGTFEEFNASNASLPSQVFDIKGRKITEFFSEEKRELVRLDDLPVHLIYALITREDQDFFRHQGFNLKGIFRGLVGIATGRNLGGGSTLTQQLAGMLYADRTDRSVTRKLRELWYSIQLERQWTKQQILEEYLNKVYFGHGTYGVETASKFYFGHSAKEITIAESAILVIQLANPTLYSPLKNPNRAQLVQREILNQMVELGYTDKKTAADSYDDYWNNYDRTRDAGSSVFINRKDLAPYFSEYVREQLNNEYLLGAADIDRDGYKIYTTLNLDYQIEAEKLMVDGIDRANKTYRANHDSKSATGVDTFVPIVDSLSLLFDIQSIRVGGVQQVNNAREYYRNVLNPTLDLLHLSIGTSDEVMLRTNIKASYDEAKIIQKRTTVEGSLISIDNDTGYIVAMVGGSKFESSNQFNRSVQARIQPGSSFKPLYYAAAIEKGVISPATRVYDAPIVFTNDDGSEYTPLNYNGVWEGPVQARRALAKSMNVPSLRILNWVGFDDAISISSKLLGIPPEELSSRNFERKYPLGLGIVAVSPIEITRAFSVFPRLGRENKEISIRYIQDRNGKIIVEPEKEIREAIAKRGGFKQVISPATAYIMCDMLQTTVQEGTLNFARNSVGGFTMPFAGKTGTTQNWADAWTVGFSAYLSTSVWLGFDRGGANSLGTNQTGALTAGPIWAKFMKFAHNELPVRHFTQPQAGIVYLDVTTNAGLLPPENYTGSIRKEIFKAGTEPTEYDWEALEMQIRQTEREATIRKHIEELQRQPKFSDLDTTLVVPQELMDNTGLHESSKGLYQNLQD